MTTKSRLSDIEKSKLQTLAQNRLDDLLTHIFDSYSISMPMPSLTLDQRGRIAGSALLKQNHIRLNANLFNENREAFLKEVIPHELAHLIVHRQYGRVKPHGVEWKQLMQDVFNIPPNTRHAFDVKSVSQATHKYRCRCGTIELSLIRHNKVLKGKQSYMCKICKQELVQSTN